MANWGLWSEGNPDISYEDACRLGDLTTNPILDDPLMRQIVDPF